MKFERRNDWGTPRWLFQRFDDEFGFTINAAAHAENYKLDRYRDLEANGLKQEWSAERVWCNPPYGAGIDA